MTGPEHYREAERLLDPKGPLYVAELEAIPIIVARAQVHATLALAAATAFGGRDAPPDIYGPWYDAAGKGADQ